MKLLPIIPCSLLIAIALGGAFQAAAAPAVVVSIADQKLALVEDGEPVAQFSISTSKFGVGDRPGSYATPLGLLEIASKIGANAPLGTVFKSRAPTGEILRPNARGRDPIVTRILWLRGLEKRNARAHDRAIYIHGTPVERLIGRPSSYGCIRMRSRDVAHLFNAVSVGTRIAVVTGHLRDAIARTSAGALDSEFGFASN
ncbi:MAG TPA: L,D-transpeptidase [Chthoniobacterales bacterium]|nr:L,D-transpeptidase [Chthoniobacterales bacterium]